MVDDGDDDDDDDGGGDDDDDDDDADGGGDDDDDDDDQPSKLGFADVQTNPHQHCVRYRILDGLDTKKCQ